MVHTTYINAAMKSPDIILIASRIPPGLLSALGLAILICMGMHMTIDVAI